MKPFDEEVFIIVKIEKNVVVSEENLENVNQLKVHVQVIVESVDEV